MIKRFFKRSQNIDGLEQKEIETFLREEKILDKVEPRRVMDFYNMLSSLAVGEEVQEEERIDYEHFKADTEEKREKIEHLKDMEKQWARGTSKTMMTGDRILKAASFLAYKFEKSLYGGKDPNPPPEDINNQMSNLFRYSEDDDIEDKPATFGEMMDINCDFMNYVALLTNKKAFMKTGDRLERATNGTVSKYTGMESFEEIFNVDMIQMVMPNFNRKLAEKDLQVKARFKKVQRGQNLIMIIDDSGSMSDQRKRAMLKAILMLKLQAANENHNIYISMFETQVKGFIKVDKTLKFDNIPFIRLGGGGTDVNGCVMSTIDMIRKRKLKAWKGADLPLSDDHFEIMVINDGQDDVDPSYHPAIKIHGCCLIQSNRDLKNICHRSGGTYHNIKPVE